MTESDDLRAALARLLTEYEALIAPTVDKKATETQMSAANRARHFLALPQIHTRGHVSGHRHTTRVVLTAEDSIALRPPHP